MAKKDIAQKKLEMYNDVFADIFNAIVFGGEDVVKEDSLEDAKTETFYTGVNEEGSRSQYRDVAKFWRDEGVRICLLGLENQSYPDTDMVIRVLSYDAAAYKDLLTKKTGDKIGPVVTLVLYFGMKPWNAPQSLLEYLGKIPKGLKKFVSDYRINVIDIPRLPRETIDRMTSDFYIIADHYWQLVNNGDYVPDKHRMKHVRELIELFAAMNQDIRFLDEKIMERFIVEGGSDMSAYLDKVIAEGEARGEARGRAEGEARGRIAAIVENVRNMMDGLKWTSQAVMDVMKILAADRPAILAAL